jgi:hypothetical protein
VAVVQVDLMDLNHMVPVAVVQVVTELHRLVLHLELDTQ